ncbi:MAG TPA: ADOP family duplicated permease [Acidobacteriota bacterium]|nr:ADOP family duplicated permease [Acidobacteriota bacterium]
MSWFLQDLRLALRGLSRSPGYAFAVAAILALGIGANSAIFTFVDQVLLRPLPFPRPWEIQVLSTFNPRQGSHREDVSIPELTDWRERNRSFRRLVGYTAWGLVLTGDHEPEDIPAVATQPGLFRVLGADPLHGRTFTESDERVKAVVLSHSLWKRRFDGDPAVVGRTARLDGEPYLVTGVMKPDFAFPTPAVEAWIPLQVDTEGQSRHARWMHVIGRLKDGVVLDQARQEFNALAAALAEEHPDSNRGWQIALEPLPQVVSARARSALWLLQGAVVLVLLIAVVNAAGMLLARCQLRRREMAIRRALGAGRGRIFLGALAENTLLCLGGGALGVLAAALGVRTLARMMPGSLQSSDFHHAAAAAFPLLKAAGLDWRAALVAAGVSLAAAVLLALIASSLAGGPARRLNESGYSQAGPASQRPRQALVAAQVALAVIPLAGAAVLTRQFVEQLQVDPGFEVDNLLTFEVSIGYLEDASQRAAFARRIQREVSSIPGVESAAYNTVLPFSSVDWRSNFHIAGRKLVAQKSQPMAVVHRIHPDYFRTLGIGLKEGRLFDSRDQAGSRPLVVINETAASRYWPGESPVGESLYFRSPRPALEIVGVTESILSTGLDAQPLPEIYLLFDHSPAHYFRMAVRTAVPPADVLPAVKSRIWEANPDLPITEVASMRQVLNRTLTPQRFTLGVMGVFAAAALILSAAGTYAAIAFMVAQRRRELSVRMALGAGRGRLTALVIGSGMRPALAGIGLGLLGAVLLWTVPPSWSPELTLSDAGALASSALLLSGAALLACLLPALRASSSSPAAVMRTD